MEETKYSTVMTYDVFNQYDYESVILIDITIANYFYRLLTFVIYLQELFFYLKKYFQ